LVISKISEKLTYNRLIPFFSGKNVLIEAQNGFRNINEQTQARQTFIESVQEASNRELHATGFSLIYQKVFFPPILQNTRNINV
jgi:hypothetical protein